MEVEPVKVIKSGSIFGIKTKDNGWARARVLSSNQDKSSLLLGDIGEVTEVDNYDIHQLPEEFKFEDFFSFRVTIPAGDWSKEVELAGGFLNTNPIIVEVRKSVLYSRSNMYFFILDFRLRDTRFWLRGPGPRLRSFLLSPCPAHASMIGLGPGLIAKNGLGISPRLRPQGLPKMPS